MWHLPDELEEHFDEVKERRNDGNGHSSNGHGGRMMRNEYAKGRGREAVNYG